MNKYFLFSISCLLIFFNPYYSRAQERCSQSLIEAQEKLEQGKFYDIPELLNPCLDNGFSKEEKIRAYHLLTLAYLYLNYEKEADESYLNLLRLSPEFSPDPEIGPQELINHHKQFTTRPMVFISMFKLGTNFTKSNLLYDYSMTISGNNSESVTAKTGVNFGLGVEVVLSKDFHLMADLFMVQNKFRLDDFHWDFYRTSYELVHNHLELPVGLKYKLPGKKILPYVVVGMNPKWLFKSNAQNIEGNYVIENEDGTIETFPVQPHPDINTSNMKNSFNYSLFGGVGFVYRMGLNIVSLEARYEIGMLNVANEKNRWRTDFEEARNMKFPFAFVDNDYKLNSLTFMVGFIKPLYKPRKLKKRSR